MLTRSFSAIRLQRRRAGVVVVVVGEYNSGLPHCAAVMKLRVVKFVELFMVPTSSSAMDVRLVFCVAERAIYCKRQAVKRDR